MKTEQNEVGNIKTEVYSIISRFLKTGRQKVNVDVSVNIVVCNNISTHCVVVYILHLTTPYIINNTFQFYITILLPKIISVLPN